MFGRLAVMAYENLREDSFTRWVLKVHAEGKAQYLTGGFATEDKAIPSLSAKGNLLLRFVNFAGRDAGFISTYYYRTTYSLCPRRVYACPDDFIMNDGADLTGRDFTPDANWLRDHKIAALVTFSYDASGQIKTAAARMDYAEATP